MTRDERRTSPVAVCMERGHILASGAEGQAQAVWCLFCGQPALVNADEAFEAWKTWYGLAGI